MMSCMQQYRNTPASHCFFRMLAHASVPGADGEVTNQQPCTVVLYDEEGKKATKHSYFVAAYIHVHRHAIGIVPYCSHVLDLHDMPSGPACTITTHTMPAQKKASMTYVPKKQRNSYVRRLTAYGSAPTIQGYMYVRPSYSRGSRS